MKPMKTIIYVLSWNRPEMLALCLGSVCYFNKGDARVVVMDDASDDPYTKQIIADYLAEGLVDEAITVPKGHIGFLRRAMFTHFLQETDAEILVQVESDMLLQPGAVPSLIHCYGQIANNAGEPIRWLCSHQHDWCHTTKVTKNFTCRSNNKLEFGIADSGSEPFWMTTRGAIEHDTHLLPGTRPDMVLFLKQYGAYVLRQPQIQAQHLGAIDSHYYPQWNPDLVTYINHDGTTRQPFPDLFKIDFALNGRKWGEDKELIAADFKLKYRQYYARLCHATNGVLPPYPEWAHLCEKDRRTGDCCRRNIDLPMANERRGIGNCGRREHDILFDPDTVIGIPEITESGKG